MWIHGKGLGHALPRCPHPSQSGQGIPDLSWGSTAPDTSVPGPWFSSEEPWPPLDAKPFSGEPSSALKFHISLCCLGLLGHSRPSALTDSFRLESWAQPTREAPLRRLGRGMCVWLLGRPDGLVMSPGVGDGGGHALLVCPLLPHSAASALKPAWGTQPWDFSCLLLPPPHTPPRPVRAPPQVTSPASCSQLCSRTVGAGPGDFIPRPGTARVHPVLLIRSLSSGGAAASLQPPWVWTPCPWVRDPLLPEAGTPLLHRGCCPVRWTECHMSGLVDRPVN